MSRKSDFLKRLTPLRRPLTAYCARLLWSSQELEDTLQETMMTAFRRFEQFERGTDFRAWIFRIATLTCFNMNRRHVRGAAPVESLDHCESLEKELEREYSYEEVLRNPSRVLENFDEEILAALRALTEKERSILLLKTVAGLSCAEIADVIEVPLGTAQGLLTRARMKMRERLSDAARTRESA